MSGLRTDKKVIVTQGFRDGTSVDVFKSLCEMVEWYLTGTHAHQGKPHEQIEWLESLPEKINEAIEGIKEDWEIEK